MIKGSKGVQGTLSLLLNKCSWMCEQKQSVHIKNVCRRNKCVWMWFYNESLFKLHILSNIHVKPTILNWNVQQLGSEKNANVESLNAIVSFLIHLFAFLAHSSIRSYIRQTRNNALKGRRLLEFMKLEKCFLLRTLQ